MALQDQILSQLAEIQRTLGNVVGTVEALKEEVKTQGVEASTYRETITSGLNNALVRIAALEDEIKAVKTVIDKTVRPLATGAVNMRQRVIGFLGAWSLFLAIGGFIVWIFSSGWDNLIKLVLRLQGSG